MSAVRDIYGGLLRWELWTLFAFNDIRMRYKKSWIGIGWVALSTGLLLAAKIFIFSQFSSKPVAFFAVYLATGFMIWRFMSSIVMESTSIYFTAAGWLKSEPIPFATYIFQMVTRNIITMSYSSLPVIAVCVIFKTFTIEFAISFIPVMIFLVLNALWVGLLMGILCARYRDIAHLAQTIMGIMFFLTPVIWVASDSGKLAEFVKWNPFAHFLAVFRDPLLTGEYPWFSWKIIVVITIIGWLAALWTHNRFKDRVVFWI